MKRGIVLGLLLILGGISMWAATFQNPPAGQRRGGGGGQQEQQPLRIEKVRDNLYMILGNGGNTAAFVTEAGVVVVDTKNPNNGPAILDKIKSVTPKPVTMIINTHTHNDHVGSNNAFTTSCGNSGETLTVDKASPSVSTTLSSATIVVGSSVYETAALIGGFNAGGSVTYSYFSGGSCQGSAAIVSTVIVTDGAVPNSASQVFDGAGSYSWDADYTGDSNNNDATSGCKLLTVNNVCVVHPTGDINLDCLVDISDLAQVGAAFGSTPSSPNWNSNADLDNDGVIDITDLVIVAANFGQHTI